MPINTISETALTRQIEQYLCYCPDVFFWRQNVGGATYEYVNKKGVNKKRFVSFGYPGVADIIGCVNGRFLAIEVKVGKNTQSDHQIEFQRQVEAHGGLYILAYCLNDVLNGLRGDDGG